MCSPKSPVQAAEEYEGLLAEYFELEPKALPIFDFIFLGIGQDGHTASIFPNDRTAIDTGRWVVPVKGGSPDVHRLTLTMPVLIQARHLVFLVTGRSKADMVRTIFEQDTARIPPQHLNTSGNQVFWFLDQKAASLLTKNYADQKY
jgi:6-phosphogluconolactonase